MVDFSSESLGLWMRLQNLIVMENILLVLFLLVSYDNLPQWFRYLEKIRFNYTVAILNLEKIDKINKNNQK